MRRECAHGKILSSRLLVSRSEIGKAGLLVELLGGTLDTGCREGDIEVPLLVRGAAQTW